MQLRCRRPTKINNGRFRHASGAAIPAHSWTYAMGVS
jgi:hypothetical protein